jgi:hypothetical protein
MVALQGLLPFEPPLPAKIAGEDKLRIRRIQEDRYVENPAGREILNMLEDLLRGPKVQRPVCAFVHGDSNSGKTALAQKMWRDHRSVSATTGTSEIPAVYVDIPPYTDLSGFYDALLRAVDFPVVTSRRPSTKWHEIIGFYPVVKARLVLIDEVNNLTYGRQEHRQMILNSFKALSNELKIPVVAFGTKEVARAFHLDPQLANRFKLIGVPRWAPNSDYAMFLQRYATSLDLAGYSDFRNGELVARVHHLSEGLLGESCNLLTELGVRAVRSKREVIDLALLDELDWTRPGERRRVAG